MSGLEPRLPKPCDFGYRMPAEWAAHEATWLAWPHEATWLAWPHEVTDWPGKFPAIPFVYAEIVRQLARREKVRILVNDAATEKHARQLLSKYPIDLSSVEFFEHPTDRSWTRDYCPLFVRNPAGEVANTNWIFNGWAKYDNWADDNDVPAFLAQRLELECFEPGVVLEGGSIDVNGACLLLTTEECLLSPIQARNPALTRTDLERCFHEYLGVDRVIWLHHGIAGDDTHGHIDDLARFVDAGTIILAVEDDPSEINYEPLQENLALLKETGLRVCTLPMPEPIFFDGQRLPASYANFYIANGLVLVPTFNDPHDRVALNTLAELFPDREVVGIACSDLVLGLGTLHCMTQQQPATAAS